MQKERQYIYDMLSKQLPFESYEDIKQGLKELYQFHLEDEKKNEYVPYYSFTTTTDEAKLFNLIQKYPDSLLLFLHEKNLLLDILPDYINETTHTEENTFHIIKELFISLFHSQHKSYNSLGDKNTKFTFLEKIIDKIDKPYLVCSKYWSNIYHYEATTAFPMSYSFIERYHPFFGCSNMFFYQQHLFRSNLQKDKKLFFFLIAQNSSLFKEAFMDASYRIHQRSDIYNFCEEEALAIYHDLTHPFRNIIKDSIKNYSNKPEEQHYKELLLSKLAQIDQYHHLNHSLKDNKITTIKLKL